AERSSTGRRRTASAVKRDDHRGPCSCPFPRYRHHRAGRRRCDVKTMTLNLPEPEMTALDTLATEKDMSKTAVLRQALRMYQRVHVRTGDCWEIDFVDKAGRSHRQVMCPRYSATRCFCRLTPPPANPPTRRSNE